MATEENRQKYPDYAEAVELNRFGLPLVAIDGKVWFSGYVDHRSIVRVIERKLATQKNEG